MAKDRRFRRSLKGIVFYSLVDLIPYFVSRLNERMPPDDDRERPP
jgi:hypothetical protein